MINPFKKNKKDPETFEELLSRFKDLEKKLQELSEGLEVLGKKNNSSIQRVGIVRFNSFSGQGGNQSFSIALLDGKNSGLTITSLYGREGNRVFAKSIERGKAEYTLSDEEKEAIKRALDTDDS